MNKVEQVWFTNKLLEISMLNKKKKTCNIPGKYFPKKNTKEAKDLCTAKVEPTGKETNLLANLTHKNSSGANNWYTFIKLQTENSTDVKMDCSEEYTTLETILPTQSNVDTKSSTRVKPMTQGTNINNKAKKAKGFKPKYKPFDQVGLTPPKIGSNQYKNYSNKTKVTPKVDRNLDENGITSQIAIDCEMVGVEVGVNKDMLARVSIVNSYGNCIYDTFVKPVEPVLDYRTFVSGVRPEDLENAPDFASVQKKVAEILKDRILVGHGLKKDLAVLFLNHPRVSIRDTTKYGKFRQGKPPSLKKLAKEYLGVTIQNGEHDSVQDALAAMQLYKMFKKDWENSLKKKKKRHVKEKQVPNLQATVTQAMALMDV